MPTVASSAGVAPPAALFASRCADRRAAPALAAVSAAWKMLAVLAPTSCTSSSRMSGSSSSCGGGMI